MTDKEFNLSDEYAAECVQLPPQEEVGDSKTYTSESIGNLRRMLTEISKSGTITKTRIWLESHTVKHLRHLEWFLEKWKFHFLS